MCRDRATGRPRAPAESGGWDPRAIRNAEATGVRIRMFTGATSGSLRGIVGQLMDDFERVRRRGDDRHTPQQPFK
jgi:hypothetical protein